MKDLKIKSTYYKKLKTKITRNLILMIKMNKKNQMEKSLKRK